MKAQILTADELPEAVRLAQGVFNYCLRGREKFPQNIHYFEEYVEEENIRACVEAGQLVLWGIREQGHLIAVSGLQRDGHITMIYVLPDFQRRGYGSELLHEMRCYAKDRLELATVSINAIPVWTAQYFFEKGFWLTERERLQVMSFVPMRARTIHELRFARKPIPAGWLLGTTLGGLSLCMLVAVIYMVSYLMR